jgi:glycosyltransferase involved in cell wall biosynthesis
MRIGINCSRIAPQYRGGVNSFTFGLLDAFAQSRRGHDFVIFATPRNRSMFERFEKLEKFKIIEIDGPFTRIGRGLFNRIPASLRFRLPYRHYNHSLNRGDAERIAQAVDVQYVPYCPMPIFPFPEIPTIYSIHDLQHVHYPQFFTASERLVRDTAFANTVAHATLIQASTHHMAGEFAAHFSNLPLQKIIVVPEGVDIAAFSKTPERDVRSRYGLPERFLFFPAQLWPHKNHITIFKALAQLRSSGIDIPLVLTGARYSGSDDLLPYLETGAPNNIHYLGVVPYPDIVALHRAARFLVTASLYESSSIPILEACAAGTPIIASAAPAHVEQAKVLQMQLFPSCNPEALADILRNTWNDDALIARHIAHNAEAIKAFTWNNAAERYLDAMESVHRQRAGKK